MTDLTDAARDYLAAGLQIIALTGKKPNTTFHPHGLKDAMSGVPENADDDALIGRVFTHSKTTGVGILIPHNMLVADVDSDEAAATLAEMFLDGIADTAVAKTRNGLHFWFITPKVSGSIWIDKLLFRGVGSYVCAPPSVHPDGGTYEWIAPLVDDESGMLSGLEWAPAKVEAYIAASLKAAAEKPTREPAYFMGITFRKGGFTLARELDKGALDGLRYAIIHAEDGNQNSTIAWAAMCARDEGVPLEVAMEQLLSAALEGNHPRERAIATIQAAYKRAPRG